MVAQVRALLVSSLVLALSCVALASCVNVNAPSAPEIVRLAGQTPRENVGWALLSLTGSGEYKWIMRTAFYFRGTSNAIEGRLVGFDSKLLSDTPRIPEPTELDYEISADDPLGSMKLLELPAGDYEFYRFHGAGNPNPGMSSVTYTLSSTDAFLIKFRVAPGQVTYIGNMNLAFGADRSGRFELSDRRARDIALFRAQFAEFRNKDVEIALGRR